MRECVQDHLVALRCCDGPGLLLLSSTCLLEPICESHLEWIARDGKMRQKRRRVAEGAMMRCLFAAAKCWAVGVKVDNNIRAIVRKLNLWGQGSTWGASTTRGR